jgi:hypothetical protein
LKNSWQTYVVNKRSVLSKVPGYWDDLLNKYSEGYAREYKFAPNKPPAPLRPQDVVPPGSYLERKFRSAIVEPARQAAASTSRAAVKDVSREADRLMRQAEITYGRSADKAQGAGLMVALVGGAVALLILALKK